MTRGSVCLCGRTIAGGRAVSTEDPTAIHPSATIRMLSSRVDTTRHGVTSKAYWLLTADWPGRCRPPRVPTPRASPRRRSLILTVTAGILRAGPLSYSIHQIAY